ncbi:MAG: DUF4056 domain-containing protein, partial [Verrucomicrobiota bacterium]
MISTRTLLIVVFLLTGWNDVGARPLDEKQAKVRPRLRIGSPPFPFIFFRALKKDQLGEHHYRALIRLKGRMETSRGICYTTRAGFVDISHVRKAIDWTAYLHARIRRSLIAGESGLHFKCSEPSYFYLTFNYPPDWEELEEAIRERFIEELSLRIAQETSLVANNWHEILTWYGFKTALIFPEKVSSFSYEDIVSHVLGVQIAETAIRDASRPYNRAVEVAFRQRMDELGMVSRENTRKAIRLVKGIWWKRGDSLKRFLHFDPDQPSLTPWLVRDLSFTDEVDADPLTIPKLETLDGRDFSAFYRMEIKPRVCTARKFMPLLPGRPSRIEPNKHFPLILENIQQSIEKKFGPHAT